MSTGSLIEYLSTLLNRPVAASQHVTLSSAQRARLLGWLESQGRSVDADAIKGSFEVGALAIEPRQSEALPARKPARTSARSAGLTPPRLPGVGIDIQSVSELISPKALIDLKADSELRAIFSLRELSYASAKDSPADTLAGIFAAKEALRKADPGLLHQALTDIEILPDDSGAPTWPGFAISISHSAGMAVAIAIQTVGTRQDLDVGAAVATGRRVPEASADIAPASEQTRRLSRISMIVIALLVGGAVAGMAGLRSLIR
jgi:phosphopantetheine--protein transferase-like protein